MDKLMRAQIVAEVRKATMEAMEVVNERYLTPDELCKQFGFAPSWLKTHGRKVPRVAVPDTNRFVYPQHKIARMMCDGTFMELFD